MDIQLRAIRLYLSEYQRLHLEEVQVDFLVKLRPLKATYNAINYVNLQSQYTVTAPKQIFILFFKENASSNSL